MIRVWSISPLSLKLQYLYFRKNYANKSLVYVAVHSRRGDFLRLSPIKVLKGWEFAHLISERIARFLPKNERMSDLLKTMCDSLIRSFLVSDLSASLTIAHFLWAMWANCSFDLSKMSDSLLLLRGNERSWANRSHRSPKLRKWAIHSFNFFFFFRI